MNFKVRVDTIKSVLFATVLLANCFPASLANAQSVFMFHGRFTLPHETTWAGVVLPAGEYVITLDDGAFGGPAIASIRNAATGKSIGTVPSNYTETEQRHGLFVPKHRERPDNTSANWIEIRNSNWVVQSFRVAELGKVFIYDRASTHGRGSEEAGSTEIVPVLQAKK